MTGKLRIILAFCLSIVLLMIIGFYSYSSTKKYNESYEWVNRSQQIISEAQSLAFNLQMMEASHRGYIITGNPRYLDPYLMASAEIDSNYRTLTRLVDETSEQRTLLEGVYASQQSKVEMINASILIRRTQGLRAAQKLILTNQEEEVMQQFRTDIERFIENEKSSLAQSIQLAQRDYKATIATIIMSLALAIIIVLTTFFFFIKDYHKMRLSQMKLLESEERTKKFLEALPVGVFVLNKEGKSYYANGNAATLFGPGTDPDIKLEDFDLRNQPDDYKTYRAGTDDIYPPMEFPIVRALMGEKNVCVEDIEVSNKGKRIPLRINASHITDSSGNIEFAIAVFQDITDTREANVKLNEAIKVAEQAMNLKETFLANMSHEIRTPMNAIIGFTNLLSKSDLNEKETDYVHTIKTSGENLLRIINDILDVSKIKSGMMLFETHSISIREVFSSLNAMLQPRATDKNLALKLEAASNVPAAVLGDPTRLTQILLNLLGNAIKFTATGGVEVYAEATNETAESCEILFTVKDTGIGIPRDKVGTIFERFTQAESHTTRQYGGTGLGLSIAKQLVELQGGWIKVTSDPGVGSVFTFSIPFVKTSLLHAEKSAKTNEAAIQALSQKRILLVEDNAINVKFVQNLFAEYNIIPDLAENGIVAVSKIKSTDYDVVLMDIEMPGMNGYEATRAIRHELNSKVPIIAMTAHAMAGESEKCLGLGMNAYISKPIREELLFEKMVNLIARNEIGLPVTDNGTVSPIAGKEQAVAPVKPAEKLINLEFLATSMKGKNDLILETIDLFFVQVKNDIDELNDAFENNDHLAIKRSSHRMKSTVSLVGAKPLEIILGELEEAARQNTEMAALHPLKTMINALSIKTIDHLRKERINHV